MTLKVKGCKVTDNGTFHHVTIVGPMNHSKAAFDQIRDANGRVTSSGPYTDRRMFPKVDVKRFKITAEIPMGAEGWPC